MHAYFQHRVQAFIAALPLTAGLSAAMLVAIGCDVWHETHRRRSRLEPPFAWGETIVLAVILLAFTVAAHYFSLRLTRWYTRQAKVLGLSGSGWWWLFAAAYAVGCALGSVFIFTKR